MNEIMDDVERADLHQRIGQLETENAAMRRPRTDEGLNAVSLQSAQKIEDLFAEGHIGGRTQRLAKVQVVVRETIRTALHGAAHWNAFSGGNNVRAAEGAFEQADYTMLDTCLRTAVAMGNDKEVRALLSNNFNIILASLGIAGGNHDSIIALVGWTAIQSRHHGFGALSQSGPPDPRFSGVTATTGGNFDR